MKGKLEEMVVMGGEVNGLCRYFGKVRLMVVSVLFRLRAKTYDMGESI